MIRTTSYAGRAAAGAGGTGVVHNPADEPVEIVNVDDTKVKSVSVVDNENVVTSYSDQVEGGNGDSASGVSGVDSVEIVPDSQGNKDTGLDNIVAAVNVDNNVQVNNEVIDYSSYSDNELVVDESVQIEGRSRSRSPVMSNKKKKYSHNSARTRGISKDRHSST